MKRIVYVHGTRATGKTTLVCGAQPAAVVGFDVVPPPPRPLDYPWSVSLVDKRDYFWPSESESGQRRRYDFSERERCREILGIQDHERFIRFSLDGFNRHTAYLSGENRKALLREALDTVLADFDLVVVEGAPLSAPIPGLESIVALAASPGLLRVRSESAAWGGRTPFDWDVFAESARKIAQNGGRFWPGEYECSSFWFLEGEWVPLEEATRRQTEALAPWYQHAEPGGVPVARKGSLNGEERWRTELACMPSLKGARFLDVGTNAGYMARAATRAGAASVVAYEASTRFAAQFRLAVEMGVTPTELTSRIDLRERHVQTEHPGGPYDVALLSAVHYHVNRSGVPAYREPRADYGVEELLPPLAVLLEDLLGCAETVVVATNVDHARREASPYPEAEPAWIVRALEAVGFVGVEQRQGLHGTPIVTGKGRRGMTDREWTILAKQDIGSLVGVSMPDALQRLVSWTQKTMEHVDGDPGLDTPDPIAHLGYGKAYCGGRVTVFQWLVCRLLSLSARYVSLHHCDGQNGHVVTEVCLPDGKWAAVDVDHGYVYQDDGGQLLSVQDLLSSPDIVQSIQDKDRNTWVGLDGTGLAGFYGEDKPMYEQRRDYWLSVANDRNGIDNYKPGSNDWIRALLAFFNAQVSHRPDSPCMVTTPAGPLDEGNGWADQQVKSFCWLCEGAGVEASPVSLSHVSGCGGHSVAVVGPRGVVVDVDHGYIVCNEAGEPAPLKDVRFNTNFVAAQRDPWLGPDEIGMEGFYTAGPSAINFMIGDSCNAECEMCWQAARRAKEPESDWHPELSAEIVRTLVDRYRDSLNSIELVSFGEPMMNPDFGLMVRAVLDASSPDREMPIKLNVVTNGSLLHRHLELLELPGDMTVSIDASTPKLYQKIRKGLSFRRLLENLRAAVSYPRRSPGRDIGINFVATRANIRSLRAMGDFAAKEKVTYLSILLGAALDSTEAKGKGLKANDPRLSRAIDRIRKEHPELRVNDYATGRTRLQLPDGTLPGRDFCGLPWTQFDVGPDGEVHPCCRAYHTTLCSWNEDPWTNEEARELRKQMLTGDLDAERFPCCAACPMRGSGA